MNQEANENRINDALARKVKLREERNQTQTEQRNQTMNQTDIIESAAIALAPHANPKAKESALAAIRAHAVEILPGLILSLDMLVNLPANRWDDMIDAATPDLVKLALIIIATQRAAERK